MPPEIPAEVAPALVTIRRDDLLLTLLFVAGDEPVAVMPSEVLDRLFAAASASAVQGPVKECPQSAPGSTESAQTPTSRVSVPPEGAEGISEPHGEHDELAAARVRADVAEVVIRDLRAAVARVRALADRWGVTDPGARDEILATLDGPPAVPEQAGEPATPDHEIYAVVFNAIQPALGKTGDWVRLTARQNVAAAVLEALAEHGYLVTGAPPKPIYDGPATLTDQSGTPLDVRVQVIANRREDTGDCTVLAAVQHHAIAFWLGTRCTLRLPDGRETALAKVMSMGSLVELHGPQPAPATTEETGGGRDG